MFAPSSTVAGLIFALLTLACWGSWSTTLVLASDSGMPFELFYFNFAISFMVTAIVVGFVIGYLPGDMPNPKFEGKSFIDELFGHDFGTYLLSILGGVLWNLANILLCKGIGLMGQALGFPMCVGLGMISGSLVSYIIAGTNSLVFLIAGDVLALFGICAVGFLASRKESELARKKQKEPLTDHSPTKAAYDPPMIRKFIICVIGGLLLGLANFGINNATRGEDKMSAPANQVFFSVGVLLTSAIVIPLTVCYPIEGHPATTTIGEIWSGYKDVKGKDHCLAALGGFCLCCGFFWFNIGNGTELGPAPCYSIGQSAPLVGILWGTLFFQEFAGTSWGVKGLIPVVLAFFLGAIVCLAQA